MAPILTIFGPNRSQRRNLFFEKFSNERRRHRGIVVVVIVAVVVAAVAVATIVAAANARRHTAPAPRIVRMRIFRLDSFRSNWLWWCRHLSRFRDSCRPLCRNTNSPRHHALNLSFLSHQSRHRVSRWPQALRPTVVWPHDARAYYWRTDWILRLAIGARVGPAYLRRRAVLLCGGGTAA